MSKHKDGSDYYWILMSQYFDNCYNEIKKPRTKEEYWEIVNFHLTKIKLIIKLIYLFGRYLWDDRSRHAREFNEWLFRRKLIRDCNSSIRRRGDEYRAKGIDPKEYDHEMGSTFAGTISYDALRNAAREFVIHDGKITHVRTIPEDAKGE